MFKLLFEAQYYVSFLFQFQELYSKDYLLLYRVFDFQNATVDSSSFTQVFLTQK